MIRSSPTHAPQHRSIEHGVSLGLVSRVTNEGKERTAELRLYLKEKKGNKTKFIIITYKPCSFDMIVTVA